MINCEQFNRNLKYYILNELSFQVKMHMDNHMKTCEDCKKVFQTEKEYFLSLNSLDNKDIPEIFHSKMKRDIMLKVRNKQHSVLNFKLAYSFISIFVIAIISFLIFNNRNNVKSNKHLVSNKINKEKINIMNIVSINSNWELQKTNINTVSNTNDLKSAFINKIKPVSNAVRNLRSQKYSDYAILNSKYKNF